MHSPRKPLPAPSLRRTTFGVATALALCATGPAGAGAEPDPPRGGELVERIRTGHLHFAQTARPAAAVSGNADPRTRDVAARIAASLETFRARGGPTKTATASPTATTARRRERGAPLQRRTTAPSGETVDVARAAGVATPRQIRGARLHAGGGTGTTRAARDTETARSFLRSRRDLLRLSDPDAELQVERTDLDDLGCRQVRFAQKHRGLDVWPADLVVQVRGDGSVDSMSGAFVPTPRRVVTRPTVSAMRAAVRARAAVAGGPAADVSAPRLFLHAGGASAPRLAWKFEVTVSEAERWLVVVDAHTGAVLESFDQVAHEDVTGSGTDLGGTTRPLHVWKSGATHFMVDTSKPMFDPTSSPPDPFGTRGGIVVIDANHGGPQPPFSTFHVTSSNPFSWPLADAVSASFGLSQTYDYYLQRHARNSLDGEGGTITAVVRIGSNFENAFWNGQYMAFGDALPYAASLDVVGHELTHGVTEKTAALVYKDQSGALNEAFSDIFGEMVESRTTGGQHDWKVGTALPSAFRDMRDPGSIDIQPGLPFPAKMSQFIETSQDNGGVHLNSSIINHAFYLLAEGLPGAVGTADAERIFYRTLTTKLVTQSRFTDCRLGAIASAEELFGAGSAQASATAAAFDAVEILDAAPTGEPLPAPAIDGPDSTVFLTFDPGSGAVVLGRRETDLGDGAQGVALAAGAGLSRPSVTGDGATAVLVSADQDVCLVDTLGVQAPDCAGVPGSVFSVAIAPDGSKFAFVLRDQAGDPDNTITVIDTAAGTSRTFTLTAPLLDGGSVDVLLADTMDFSRDGSFLVYDAFNVLSFADGSQLGLWSIYGLDLATETVFSLVEPTPGLDIGSPSLSHTSDRYLTFEADDPSGGGAAVVTRDLFTGEFGAVAAVPAAATGATPAFTGDDLAIVYTVPAATNTGASLVRQGLADDRLTPAGAPTTWLTDAAYGVIYRRGEMAPPPPPAEWEFTFETGAPRVESLSLDVPVGTEVVPVRLALTHTASGAFTAGGTCTVGSDPVTVSGKLSFRASTRTWSYALSLRSSAPKIRAQITGTVTGGSAKVVYAGPQGTANVTAAAGVESFAPTSRVTLRPQVDLRGRVRGTATILGGFGNDGGTVGRLSGTVKRGSLTFTVKDGSAKRRLDFKGARTADGFAGKLKFQLPPVKGTASGVAVPDLF